MNLKWNTVRAPQIKHIFILVANNTQTKKLRHDLWNTRFQKMKQQSECDVNSCHTFPKINNALFFSLRSTVETSTEMDFHELRALIRHYMVITVSTDSRLCKILMRKRTEFPQNSLRFENFILRTGGKLFTWEIQGVPGGMCQTSGECSLS